MHASIFFLAPLAALFQLGTALPTETDNVADKIIRLPTVPLNQTRYWAELHGTAEGDNVIIKRDSCASTSPYNQGDMDRLIQSLQSDGQVDYVPATSSVGWQLGTAVICTYNNYIFDNTHVSHWEQGWGGSYIKGLCCPNQNSNPQCAGGSCTGHGDSGLSVIISSHNSAYSC